MKRMLSRLGAVLAGGMMMVLAVHAQAAEPANPCAPRNPCAVKPGQAGRELDPRLITRPAGTTLATGDHAQLLQEGKQLWQDTRLSSNGLSCDSCHKDYGAFQPGFAQPYPHAVAMVQEKAGLAKIHLDEMVQGCMVMPMAAKPFPWDSRQLAALTAYTAEMQKSFKPERPAATNPCAPKNPCGGKH